MTLSSCLRGCSRYPSYIWRGVLHVSLILLLVDAWTPRGASGQGAPLFQLNETLSLTEEYTDNFLRTSRDKQSNFRHGIAPGISLKINAPKTKGEVVSSFNFSRDSVDDENNLFYSGSASLTWAPNPRLTLSLVDFLSRTDAPSVARSTTPEAPEDLRIRQNRATFLSNSGTARADYLIGNVQTSATYRNVIFNDSAPGGEDTLTQTWGANAGTSLFQNTPVSLGYSYSISDFSRSTDTTTHTFSASISRILGPFTTAGLSGSYALINGIGRDSDVNVFDVGVTAAHTLPELSVSGRVGYSRSDAKGSRSDEDSVVFGVTLSRTFAKAQANVSYDQGLVQSFLQGQNFGIVKSRRVNASLSYPWTPGITTTLNGFYSHNDFTGQVTTTGTASAGTTTENVGTNLDLSIQLLRWLQMVLGYSWDHSNSSRRGEDYDANTGRASLTGVF